MIIPKRRSRRTAIKSEELGEIWGEQGLRKRLPGLNISGGLMAAFLLLAIISVAGTAAKIQAERLPESEIVKVELLIGTKDFSSPFLVGIKFELASDWYLYWVNPGDAGLATEIRWVLPDGLEAGSLIYPIPEKFVSGGIVAYGYKKEVVLLSRMTPGTGFQLDKKTTIVAEIDWLVCKESCLRGQSQVAISLAELKAKEDEIHRGRALIEDFRLRLPLEAKKLSLSLSDIRIHHSGHRFEVEASFSGEGTFELIDFYPYPLEEGTFEHAGIRASGKSLTIPIVLFDERVFPRLLPGVLMIEETVNGKREKKGYEIEIPLEGKGVKINAEFLSLARYRQDTCGWLLPFFGDAKSGFGCPFLLVLSP